MPDGEVVGVAEAGVIERNVDVVAPAPALAGEVVIGLDQLRPEGAQLVAVDGGVEDARIAVKGLLGRLAVVDVPVDDQDSLEATGFEFLKQRLRRYGDVVEDAVAAGLGGHRVMARRADQGEAISNLSTVDGLGELYGAAGGCEGRLQGIWVEVDGVELRGLLLQASRVDEAGDGGDLREVLGRVDQEDLGFSGSSRLMERFRELELKFHHL